MKKFNFILGALGGGLAGFLLSNKKLRDKLANTKNKKEAAQILGEAIQKSGSDLAHEVSEWAKSDPVQEQLGTWKEYAEEKWQEIKKEAKGTADKAKKRATKQVKKTVKDVKKKMGK